MMLMLEESEFVITQYTVQVAAVNNAGTGPSTGIAVQTEGECVSLLLSVES